MARIIGRTQVRRPTCSARLRKNIASYSTYASGLEKLRPPQSALGRAGDTQKNSDQVCGNGAQLPRTRKHQAGAHTPPLQAIWTVPLGPRLIRIKSCVVHAQRDFVHGTDYRSPLGACLRRTSPLRASYLTQATGLGRGKAWPRRPCPAPVRLFLSTKPSCHWSYRLILVTAWPVRRRRLWADGQSVWR